jgi:transposase-like protein
MGMGRPAFPQTLLEFQARFATEEACRDYLVASRWPNGFVCSACGGREPMKISTRHILKCRSCKRQTSATAGTILHRSRVPLRLWFWSAYLVTTQTPGISGIQLQRQLGLRRYETAWVMLQKLRRAMRRPDRDRLRGVVEVDETYVGGLERGKMGGRRRDSAKAAVAAAVEVRGEGTGRVRMAIVSDATAASLVSFVERAVEPGSVVRSDAWRGYASLRKKGYDHQPTTQGDPQNASRLLPRIHRIFSNFKTWLAGTHHGVGRRHLPAYIDEYVFRFNRRSTPMAAFQSLIGLAAIHPPTTYKMLYGGESTG